MTGRPKHYWSIYEKMVVRGKEFDEINDLVGVRVDRRVGEGLLRRARLDPRAVAAGAGPVQGLHRDAQVQPLPVVAHDGGGAAGQARSSSRSAPSEMHRRAEYGVAAHWGYKEQRNPTEDLVWLQRIVDWQQETTDPAEFMQSLKIDLEQDEVFVFTPKGQVITLPTGATPVDFAYAIHTEVGHRCIGARVNGRLVPLDSALQSGDTVRDLHEQGRGRGPEPRLAAVRAHAAGPLEDPPVVLA